MKRISAKLALLLVLAALIPLTLYGIIAVLISRSTQARSISEGNLNVARRAAEQVELYVANAENVLGALAANVNRTHLKNWQQERMLRDYVLNVGYFREIYLTDKEGMEVATSRLGVPLVDRSKDDAFARVREGKPYRSRVFISEQLVPSMTLAFPLQRLKRFDGAIVGTIDLVHLWDLVDRITVGERGYAYVTSAEGLVIAHGRDDDKARVLRQENFASLDIVQAALKGQAQSSVYRNKNGKPVLGVAAPVERLGWTIVIEQPTDEAYSAAKGLTVRLVVLAVSFLVLMVVAGTLGGRTLVRPIRELIRGTRQVSQGDLNTRVRIKTQDELSELGEAFNQMTERLGELEDELRRKERAATFGRIAQGLVHDLRHPIRNIENSSRLVVRMYDNEKYRKTFKEGVERELSNVNRFLDDLTRLTKPASLAIISLDAQKVIEGVLESYEGEASRKGIGLVREFAADGARISADRFAFERVINNLMRNAIEAVPAPDGTVKVGTRREGAFLQIFISDTGCGIPREKLKDIFEDYRTTKRRGLGLGLAICKKLTEEMRGSIAIESVETQSTIVRLRFPAA